MASDRPSYHRGSSRLPGGFDDHSDDDDDHPIHLSEITQDTRDQIPDETSVLPPVADDSSSLLPPHTGSQSAGEQQGDTYLEEQEMKRKLRAEDESSFVPELSHLASSQQHSTFGDDTYLFGVPKEELPSRRKPTPIRARNGPSADSSTSLLTPENGFSSPQTPPGAYKTPAPEQQEERMRQTEEYEYQTPQPQNTSSLETMSSSPTAAAAARTVSRAISIATTGELGSEGAKKESQSPAKNIHHEASEDRDPTPRKGDDHPAVSESSSPTKPYRDDVPSSPLDSKSQRSQPSQDYRSVRPNYLRTRSSSQRLSRTSISSSNTDTTSNATIGADYAIQSGGAVPTTRALRKEVSRTTSLGSMASGISGISDDEAPFYKRANMTSDLSPLDEERPLSRLKAKSDDEPLTPKASITDLTIPSDTVIANNIRDMEVPGTFARQYRKDHRSISPIKTNAGMTPGPSRSGVPITLKGQREHVEKLSKENFDLKMKIHFLDEALQRRSEDGMNDLLTENAQLKFDRVQLQKDNFSLRKAVRDLERKMDEMNETNANAEREKKRSKDAQSQAVEEELLYLKETVETQETEIERLRSENMAKESEKRKMAEAVKSMGDSRPGTSEAGSRERLDDMWRDLLEGAESARVLAEQESKRLREENTKLRQDSQLQAKRKSGQPSSAEGSDWDNIQGGSTVSTDGTLNELERLRSQILELQKVISVQADQLTRRARKEDRLYQQIEDLRLAQRTNGARSVAGDSIFERSASRARTNSRAGNDTPEVGLSETEREELEAQIDNLRDQVSSSKLEKNQLMELIDQLDAELDTAAKNAQNEAKRFDEDFNELVLDRNNLLLEIEEQDQRFQDLQAESQREIDCLGDERDAKIDECQHLQTDLKNQEENFFHLQSEMRSAIEGIGRLERDSQQNLQRATAKEKELDDANRDIEDLERQREAISKSLDEANTRIDTLTVREEHLHHEFALQNEELESDKIMIVELKTKLEKTEVSLQAEKDRARELSRRLTEERQQREAIASKEKKDVQRIMNDLNRQATSAAEEVRQLKKSLSSCEIEAATWKERLAELENILRATLGDNSGTRASFITSITTIQKGLQITSQDLDDARRRLDEKETTLTSRDNSLESLGLEYRKVMEALERERQNRKADKHSFEQALKSHQASTRTITQNNSRITELEHARRSDRAKLNQAEQQWRDQLSERNNVLLTVWKKLSAMCGPDWTHSNSLVNGNLPSLEVIGNILFWPVFSRNLLLAAKQVEGSLGTCKDKIRRLEQSLRREYSALEANLDMRIKRLDRIEDSVSAIRQAQQHGPPSKSSSHSTEVTKLRAENRSLKSEIQFLQQHPHPSHATSHARSQVDGNGNSPTAVVPPRASSSRGRGAAAHSAAAMSSALIRHHSTNVVEHLTGGSMGWDATSQLSVPDHRRSSALSTSSTAPLLQGGGGRSRERDISNLMIASTADLPAQMAQMQAYNQNMHAHTSSNPLAVAASGGTGASASGEQKWIHRLRELERRLKAEREARLLDRSGARKRLEERDRENDGLRKELEREKERREHEVAMGEEAATAASGGGGRT